MNSVCLVDFSALTRPDVMRLIPFRAEMKADFSLFDGFWGVRLNFGQSYPPFAVDNCCRMLVADVLCGCCLYTFESLSE